MTTGLLRNGSFHAAAFLPAALAGTVALIAHGHWPYAYYELFRWLIAAGAIYAAYLMRDNVALVLACGLVAVVFNPLAPLRMPARNWQQLDLITAAVMYGISLYVFTRSRSDRAQKSV